MEFSTLQDVIVAVGEMRTANLQPHPDGFFHCTLSYDTISTLFGDPVFQRLNQLMPDRIPNKERFIGHMAGIVFYQGDKTDLTGADGARPIIPTT